MQQDPLWIIHLDSDESLDWSHSSFSRLHRRKEKNRETGTTKKAKKQRNKKLSETTNWYLVSFPSARAAALIAALSAYKMWINPCCHRPTPASSAPFILFHITWFSILSWTPSKIPDFRIESSIWGRVEDVKSPRDRDEISFYGVDGGVFIYVCRPHSLFVGCCLFACVVANSTRLGSEERYGSFFHC